MERRRVAVVTGSTGGLGACITQALASQNWDLVLVNRPSERADGQAESVREVSPVSHVQMIGANLLEVDETLRAADQIRAEFGSVDALFNIAGVLTAERVMSSAGFESHFAINTHAPYIFATRLRDCLANAATAEAPSLVVNLSSSAIKSVRRLDVDALPNPEHIGALTGAYAQSKLALTAMTCMLGPRFAGHHIIMVSVDPGPMRTGMTTANSAMPWFLRLLVPVLFRSPESVAPVLIEAAEHARAERADGALISNGKRVKVPANARDPAVHALLNELLEHCTPGESEWGI
ncbi:MAG: SDR family NAD(P)-dependent oxidoreductase [Planctomycetota bacterium]